jgi:hydrogenase/urease accessory protein HupE
MKLILSLKTLFFLIALLQPTLAFADGFTRAVFQLSNAELENQYEFIAEYPASKKSENAIIWPQGCRPSQTNQYQSNDVIIQTYLIICEAALLRGDTIVVPYEVDAAIFEVQLGAWQSRTIASHGQAGFELILQSGGALNKTVPDIAAEYLVQGVVHIWFGWDHLAFVFCLCLLTAGFRRLFWTVTAFTLGHSVSMALSFFKVLTISIPPIEAIIALSIVLIAREAWFQVNQVNQVNQANDASEAARLRMLIIIVLFGLIHGLGFASALENIGVAENERIPALIFFNLGVELGQITFVAVIFTLIAFLNKLQKDQVFARTALVLVGSVGSFWVIERIGSFSW